MRTFTVKITLENDAFVEDEVGEINRILKTVNLEAKTGLLRDINGNLVGHWLMKGRKS